MKKSEIAILNAAYEEVTGKSSPPPEHKVRVLRAFRSTTRDLYSEYLVFEDLWWGKNYEGMTSYLRQLGIRRFVVANSSSELMELLVYLLGHGYRVAGPASYSRIKDEPGFDPARAGLLIEDLRVPVPD